MSDSILFDKNGHFIAKMNRKNSFQNDSQAIPNVVTSQANAHFQPGNDPTNNYVQQDNLQSNNSVPITNRINNSSITPQAHSTQRVPFRRKIDPNTRAYYAEQQTPDDRTVDQTQNLYYYNQPTQSTAHSMHQYRETSTPGLLS